MKYICSAIFFFASLILLIRCKKEDNSLNTNVTAVKSLFSPMDSAFYDLDHTASVLFEWEQSLAEDGNLVQYIIAFDKPSGDFSSPVYEAASDGNGLYNRATLTKDVLNKICKLAGLDPAAQGTLKWTVYSTKGVNKVQASVTQLVKLKRPFGLDNPPVNVYLTGTATEGGNSLSSAIKLKQIGDGLYEIYTSLKPGTYHFTDNNSGTNINTYFISGNSIKEGSDSTTVTTSKLFRIQLNFNVLTVTFAEIKEIGLWFAPDNKVIFTLNYDHNGIWTKKDQLISFHQESWGRDERYKFRYTVNNGTSDSYEFWGSINGDNNRPTSTTNASFWYLYPVTNDQYGNCFKFVSEVDNHNNDISLFLSPDRANYTHEVVPK